MKAKQWEVRTGDCAELIRERSWRLRETARLVFADPPYNIGKDYGDGEDADRVSPDTYTLLLGRWAQVGADLLTVDGSFWFLQGDEYAAETCLAMKREGLHLRNWIKWYETFGVNCVNKFNRTSRHLFYAVVDPADFVFHPEAVSRLSDRQTKYNDKRANPKGKLLDDVWTDIPRLCGTFKERIKGFPTQLPVKLLERVISCATDPGDLVVDLFSGSGTTGEAALRLGRRYLGFELSPKYAALSRKRLSRVAKELTMPPPKETASC